MFIFIIFCYRYSDTDIFQALLSKDFISIVFVCYSFYIVWRFRTDRLLQNFAWPSKSNIFQSVFFSRHILENVSAFVFLSCYRYFQRTCFIIAVFYTSIASTSRLFNSFLINQCQCGMYVVEYCKNKNNLSV